MAALYSLKYDISFQLISKLLGEIEYKAMKAILDEEIHPEINPKLFRVITRDLYIWLSLRTFSKLFDPIPNQIVLKTSLEKYSETIFRNGIYFFIDYDASKVEKCFWDTPKTIIFDVELDIFRFDDLQSHEEWRNYQLFLPPYARFK